MDPSLYCCNIQFISYIKSPAIRPGASTRILVHPALFASHGTGPI